MSKKIRNIIFGVLASLLALIGIRTYSKRYREDKAELNRLENELESASIDLGIAEDLQCVIGEKAERIRELIRREGSLIDTARAELADNEEQLAECENRIAECQDLVAECERLMQGI